jgi:hypothetical protein
VRFRTLSLVVLVSLLAIPAAADDIPLVNWSAPPTYKPAGEISAMFFMPFQPVTPCRVYDSRTTPPAGLLTGGSSRTIPMDTVCGLPAGAAAYSIHITAFGSTPSTSYGFLTAYPTGASLPTVSTMNFLGGSQTSSAAVVPAGSGFDINVYTTTTTHFVIDVNGYYANNLGSSNFFYVTGSYASGGIAYASNTSAAANSSSFRGQSTGAGEVYGTVGEAYNGTANSAGVAGFGRNIGDAAGVLGQASGVDIGSPGFFATSVGVKGKGVRGVIGWGTSDAVIGVKVHPTTYDLETFAILGSSSTVGLAVSGNATISGSLSKGSGSFKIDHPLDPENKYLYHSFVESPDMMNIYNGNVVLAADGRAVVQLPEWFDALNRDFRYQLTAIGSPSPQLYVAQEISGNHFVIAGGQPGAKVSWMVTGVRKDPFAERFRIPVEEAKPEEMRGLYLHPEAYDLPRHMSIDRADGGDESRPAVPPGLER